MAAEITSPSDLDTALRGAGELIVCIDVGATWCPPCQQMRPIFERLRTDAALARSARFFTVDGDRAPAVVHQLRAEVYPTFLFFRAGAELHRMAGANPAALDAKLRELVKAAAATPPRAPVCGDGRVCSVRETPQARPKASSRDVQGTLEYTID